MRKEDAEMLKTLIGKKVVKIRVNLEDTNDYGFDLVFDDGTVLEIYDICCPYFKDSCGEGAGGGVGWTIDKEDDQNC